MSRIFEPFFTTKQAGLGTGLGLAVASAVANQRGGRIHAESTVGFGTTVYVDLPVHSDASVDTPVAAGLVDRSRTAPATILVAEDEADVRELIEQLLEKAGHRVLSATNGAQALAIAAATP